MIIFKLKIFLIIKNHIITLTLEFFEIILEEYYIYIYIILIY